MTNTAAAVNNVTTIAGTVAPLANVSLAVSALERAMNRPAHLPGMVVFSGPSGWGKSTAAAYTANRHRAYYVECRSTWTKKATLMAIIHEMGIPAAKTIYEMTDAICEQLAITRRPLIIDEMDFLVDKGAVEVIRDLYEGSGAAILLIGEELLPKKLERWERFHGRILDFVLAQPADIEDTQHLAKLYCPKITIGDDLLDQVNKASGGSVRRICVNLEQIQAEARAQGIKAITAAEWGGRQLFTGSAPVRKV